MKKVLLGILVVFILMQLIRPTKNISRNEVNSITTVMDVPQEVQDIIKVSCADCHSNYTVYPWFDEIAPLSWYIAQHINEGKEHLNFSEWTVYNKNQREHIISDLEEAVESYEMPLKSYFIVHKNAELNAEQHKILLDWIKTLKGK